jgi:hypothetical protein
LDDLFSTNKLISGFFPAFFKPKKEELFSSWVVRLAHAHYMKVHTFVNVYFPDQQFWNRDIDRSVSDEVISIIARKSNCSLEMVLDTTLKGNELLLTHNNNINTSSKWISPLGIYHRTWKRNGVSYCPLCLQADGKEPYFRKKWRLAFSVVCDHCGIMLHDKCPQCEYPVTFFRADLGRKSAITGNAINHCFNCSYLLSDSATVDASMALLAMQSELYRIMNEGKNKEIFYPFAYFEVLHGIIKILAASNSKSVFIREKLFKKIYIEDESFIGGFKHRFETLPIITRTKLLYAAFWLLEDWPFRFIDFFKNKEIYSSTLLIDDIDWPFWYWNVVFGNFYKSNANRSFYY